MKAEDVMKALECCVKVGGYRDEHYCNDCPLHGERCALLLPQNALALLRERNAEIERLRAEVSVKKKLLDRCVDLEDRARADTVSEIKTRFAMRYGTYTDKHMTPITEVFWLLDQIAKEMLEANE